MLQLTQFAVETSSTSGIGALGIDAKAFVIQLITFLLAFWVLKKWAFGPIVRLMDQRRETIESGVKIGEEMKIERAKLAAQVEDELHKARSQADDIIAQAHEASKQAIHEAEDKAKAKADTILAEAEDRIKQETVRARKSLEKEIIGLISDATEAIIDEKIDAKKDAQLIETALKGRA